MTPEALLGAFSIFTVLTLGLSGLLYKIMLSHKKDRENQMDSLKTDTRSDMSDLKASLTSGHLEYIDKLSSLERLFLDGRNKDSEKTAALYLHLEKVYARKDTLTLTMDNIRKDSQLILDKIDSKSEIDNKRFEGVTEALKKISEIEMDVYLLKNKSPSSRRKT